MQLHSKQLQSGAVTRTPVVKAPIFPNAGIFAKEKPLVDDQKIEGIVVPSEIAIEMWRRKWNQPSNSAGKGVELPLPVPRGKPEIGYGTPVPETVPRGVHQEPISGPSNNITPISPTNSSTVVISFL